MPPPKLKRLTLGTPLPPRLLQQLVAGEPLMILDPEGDEAMKRALSGALRPEQYLRIALRVMAVLQRRLLSTSHARIPACERAGTLAMA